MSTIVTRKSLALGAIVALAATAFAGAPANAAGELNVVPAAGTSYNTLVTEGLTLETSYAPGVSPLAASQLNYQIKTTTGVSVTAAASTTSAAAALAAVSAVTLTADTVDTAAYIGYVAGGSSSVTARNFLSVKLSGVTATSDSKDVVVTAFVDANNDGKLTAGEWNTSKTISFKKYSTVGTTVALTDLATGDTTATGSVQFADINNEQLDASLVKLHFSDAATTPAAHAGAGGAAAFAGLAGVLASSKFSVTTGVLVTAGFTSTTKVGLVAKFAGTEVGTAVTKTASARTISDFAATVDVTDNGLATGEVRTNSSFSVTALIKDVATTPAAKSGVAVKATVTSSVTGAWSTTAGSEQTVTVNGTKYDTYAKLTAAAAELALTTNADGKATVTIVPANFAAGATFTVTFSAQNYSHAVTATLTDAVYTAAEVQGAAGSYRKIAKNGSATVSYTVKDQFSALSALTNQRIAVTATNTTTATATQYVAVVAGKASATVTAALDSTAAVVISGVLEASTTASNGNVTWAHVGTNPSDVTVNVSALADSFTTAPAIAEINNAAYSATTNYKQALENKAYTATDFPVVAGATLAKLTAVVADRGADVTVSGAGLAFVVNGKVYTDTVTFAAGDVSKAITVLVASHKSGVNTVTFKTGAETKTVDVTFDTAVIASLKNTAVAVASSAQAGRTVAVTATLTDTYGNAVAGKTVNFAVDGIGSLSGATATTDAKGVATVRLTSAYGEFGDAAVTVTHDGANGTTDATDDYSVVKNVSFGVTDASIDLLGKRVIVTAEFAKGKKVTVYDNGVRKYSAIQTSDAERIIAWNVKKGSHNIVVKISGGYSDNLVLTVK
jgi:large repetitive protein